MVVSVNVTAFRSDLADRGYFSPLLAKIAVLKIAALSTLLFPGVSVPPGHCLL